MRRRPVAALAAAVAGVAVVGLVAFERRGHENDREAKLQQQVEEVVAAGVPGAMVLVRDGGRTWTAAAGVADLKTRQPLRPEMRVRIGSVTKTMVATVALQLVAEGRLGLDDTVERWLPGLVPGGNRIRIRHLLGHTSGLPDYVDAGFVRRAPTWDPRRLAEYAVDREPVAAPGTHFEYASTNYVLLGLVIEAATRSTIASQLRTRIFEPLGLARTSFAVGDVPGLRVRGYRAPERQGIVSGHLIDVSDASAAGAWAAGAVVSTMHEIEHFFAALLGGELLRPGQVRAMTPLPEHRYGLGLAVFTTRCGEAVGHTGNINGQVTVAWNTADASRQLVAMVNAFPLSADADTTLRHVLEDAFCSR